ncbi:MAG: S8/S53 family peptidase [Actinomycetota bacterium]|nr:S8/S53 family peptidase [Actinomycetota bacterium]
MPYLRSPRDPERRDEPRTRTTVPIPESVLSRLGARVLDPGRAGLVGGRPTRPTAYVADELLVQGAPSAIDALVDAASATGHSVDPHAARADDAYLGQLSDAAVRRLAQDVWVARVKLTASPGRATPPDAWSVLRRYRENVGSDQPDYTVGLNHVVTLTAGPGGVDIEGRPVFEGPALVEGNPVFEGPALVGGQPVFEGPSYFTGNPVFEGPGQGFGALSGRQPVIFLAHPPRPTPHPEIGRRPVVAVLDTGLGEHDWFTDPEFAQLGASVAGIPIGLGEGVEDSELDGIVNDPLRGTLDRDSGHGTFIAGIIRQICPDAKVLAIRVMPSDGTVDEHDLTVALNMLLVRQARAQTLGLANEVIDVLSLSLGYYHESPDDERYTSGLARTLRQFGRLGVAVVASAGNDATTTKMFPAGLAPVKGRHTESNVVPVLSVGALNPNGTISMFSNGGDWISCNRPGAAVVSTLPQTFNGGLQPARRFGSREDVDGDDFAGGFGIWSGTSFAAPVLAGELAQCLVSSGSLGRLDAESARTRAWAAIHAEVGWDRP